MPAAAWKSLVPRERNCRKTKACKEDLEKGKGETWREKRKRAEKRMDRGDTDAKLGGAADGVAVGGRKVSDTLAKSEKSKRLSRRLVRNHHRKLML